MPFAIGDPRLILRAASGGEISMQSSLPAYVKLWFAADLFLALFPPLHWAARGHDPIFGAPVALLYVFGTSAFIALSVVVAYLATRETFPNGPVR
jgi:hypothetical protein